MKEHQDSILITLSQQTIKDTKGGYRQIIKGWENSDGENMTWWYKCGNAPKHVDRIDWVYWVIKGRIRWRCKLLQVVKNKEMVFSERSKPMFSKNWLVLFDFEQVPKYFQEKRKGFQGFRYYQSLY